jgi:hypothetical protein
MKLRLDYQQIINPFYFNGLSQPKQFSGIVPTTSVITEIPATIGLFEMHNQLVYQYSSNRSIINVPDFMAEGAYWVNLVLFKKALHAQAGIDIKYYSAWYAGAYNPVTAQYYNQRLMKTGDYVFGDVFINLKVSSARIFFKYQHFNSGLMGYNYYLSPDIPMQDAAFKFGLRWVFVN